MVDTDLKPIKVKADDGFIARRELSDGKIMVYRQTRSDAICIEFSCFYESIVGSFDGVLISISPPEPDHTIEARAENHPAAA